MGLNEPRDLNKIHPDFWLLKWSHTQFLADLKAHGVPELGANLKFVDEVYDVVLVDFNEYIYACSVYPALQAEVLYMDITCNDGCDDQLRDEIWSWIQEGEVKDSALVNVHDAEALKARGVKIETTREEIRNALEVADGDHEAAYELLRERIREYYVGNPPL